MQQGLILRVCLLLIGALLKLLEVFSLAVKLLLKVFELQLEVVILGGLSRDLLVTSLDLVLGTVIPPAQLEEIVVGLLQLRRDDAWV